MSELPPWAATAIDHVMEATVVPSFSRIGPAVRSSIDHWQDPPAVHGRTIVITGATSGLGLAAARRLAALGAHLVCVGRSQTKLDAVVEELKVVATSSVSVRVCDLADRDATIALAADLSSTLSSLDVLVHNAGALLGDYTVTAEGVETTLAVHLLNQYVLTKALLPLLEASAPSRVITMTSGGMYTQKFDLATLETRADDYDGATAYAKAKRAQVVLTHGLTRSIDTDLVAFHLVHPGWANTPGVHESIPTFAKIMGSLLRSPEEGADTLVWLCGQPDFQPEAGKLWLDRRPRSIYRLPWTMTSSARLDADADALIAYCERRSAS